MQKGAERLETNVDCVNELMEASDICTPGSLSLNLHFVICLPVVTSHPSFTGGLCNRFGGRVGGVCWVDRPKGQTVEAGKESLCTVE